jgi:hypothetical protein
MSRPRCGSETLRRHGLLREHGAGPLRLPQPHCAAALFFDRYVEVDCELFEDELDRSESAVY